MSLKGVKINFIRYNAGRKSVEPYYEKKLSEKIKSFSQYYKTDHELFDIEKNETKESRPVVWEEILSAVIEAQNLIGVPKIKIMADGGHNFFKVCI